MLPACKVGHWGIFRGSEAVLAIRDSRVSTGMSSTFPLKKQTTNIRYSWAFIMQPWIETWEINWIFCLFPTWNWSKWPWTVFWCCDPLWWILWMSAGVVGRTQKQSPTVFCSWKADGNGSLPDKRHLAVYPAGNANDSFCVTTAEKRNMPNNTLRQLCRKFN